MRIAPSHLALSLLFFIFSPFVPLFAEGDSKVYVQVRSAKVKREAKNWSPGIFEVSYGDSLNVLEKAGAWYQVERSTGQKGYLHESAVSERKILLRSGAAAIDLSPTEGDIVLAGKGFNQEVEGNYRGTNSNLDYPAVDEMEKYTVSSESLSHFLVEGKLNLDGAKNVSR